MSPSKPGAITSMRYGVTSTPIATSTVTPTVMNRADAPREHVGGLVVALAEQFAVDRNERRGEHALAEEILQDVRDAEAGLERVGGGRVAEKMREDAVAHETGDPAEQDAGRDRAGVVRADPLELRDSPDVADALFVAVLFWMRFRPRYL